MSLLNLSSTDLRQALSLLEQRVVLRQQLVQVEAQLAVLEGGRPAPASSSAPKAIAAPAAKLALLSKTGRRKLKVEVVALLKAAGPEGLTVSELAARLGVGMNRVFTWFYATGSKHKQIKKIGHASYRWVG
jgi:hypothetical protein